MFIEDVRNAHEAPAMNDAGPRCFLRGCFARANLSILQLLFSMWIAFSSNPRASCRIPSEGGMNHWQGKWALITGASAGIGAAFARELAAGGTNLVLTARRRDRLVGLAAELSAKHDIRTLVCVADLAQPLGPQQIFAFTEEKNIAVDLLVNNAGFGA